jgi:hypothetical protein
VPAIVGFGAACELAAGRMDELAPRLEALRARLEQGLRGLGAVIFGAAAPRIPNTSYFAFDRIEGETLVIELDKAAMPLRRAPRALARIRSPRRRCSRWASIRIRAWRSAVLAGRGQYRRADRRIPESARGGGDASARPDGMVA